MILVIDTSSSRSAVALLEASGKVVGEEVGESGPGFNLPDRFRSVTGDRALTRVAVAIGPGSFTGLRVGVSFGLGLAIGLSIPIVTLAPLQLQAARSDSPVLAVSEAGRGRVYHLAPGNTEPGLAEPADLPHGLRAAGWLRPATEAALAAAGVIMVPEDELRSFGEAAARLIGSAPEVAYGRLRLEYMQAFSRRT